MPGLLDGDLAEDAVKAMGSVAAHVSLVKACRDLLKLRGIPVFRLNQRPVQNRNGIWSSPGADMGAPDLIACLPGGRALFIEVKTGRAMQRPVQRLSFDHWAANGALCLEVRAITDLEAVLPR